MEADGTTVGGRRLVLLSAAAFCNSAFQASFFVVVSWLALEITDRTASVGWVLLWWSVLNLTIGPLLGVAVDRFDRRRVFASGTLAAAAALGGLATYRTFFPESGIAGLHVAAIVCTIGGLVALPAFQGIVQAAVEQSRLVTASARLSLSMQVGLLAGTGLAGGLVQWAGTTAGLLFCGSGSLLAGLFVLMVTLPKSPVRRNDPVHPVRQMLDGYRYVAARRFLLVACAALALCYAAAQALSSLLGAFVKFDLQGQADDYGLIGGAWSAGAMLGASILGARSSAAMRAGIRIFGPPAVSLAILAFSRSGSVEQAAACYAALGCIFATTRVALEAWILECCDRNYIGRVHSNIEAMLGLVGTMVFLAPTFLEGTPVRDILLWFALGHLAAAGGLALLHLKGRTDPGPVPLKHTEP